MIFVSILSHTSAVWLNNYITSFIHKTSLDAVIPPTMERWGGWFWRLSYRPVKAFP